MLKIKEESFVDKIVAIKFVSGEEIIAECVDYEQSNTVIIKRPLSLVMVTNKENSRAQVNFAPWILSINDDQIVKLHVEKIMFIAEAKKDAARQYMDAIK
jgi:hypothetical protein